MDSRTSKDNLEHCEKLIAFPQIPTAPKVSLKIFIVATVSISAVARHLQTQIVSKSQRNLFQRIVVLTLQCCQLGHFLAGKYVTRFFFFFYDKSHTKLRKIRQGWQHWLRSPYLCHMSLQKCYFYYCCHLACMMENPFIFLSSTVVTTTNCYKVPFSFCK